jgi:hypothetical protein
MHRSIIKKLHCKSVSKHFDCLPLGKDPGCIHAHAQLITDMEMYGRMEGQLYTFLTSVLNGGE